MRVSNCWQEIILTRHKKQSWPESLGKSAFRRGIFAGLKLRRNLRGRQREESQIKNQFEMSLVTSTPTKREMPLLRSFGFGWRGGYNDVAPTALDATRLIFGQTLRNYLT
jgi:hypothetical protein